MAEFTYLFDLERFSDRIGHMPTTANYSWPTPADTDLVKDGAEAIRDLGNAVDTTVKAVSDASGLVHINTTSFSAVATQSINDVFSATYDFYKIVLNLTTITADGTFNLRLRVGGSDLATNYGNNSILINDDGTTAGFALVSTGVNLFQIDLANNLSLYSSNVDIFNPFLTQRTTFLKHSHGVAENSSGIRSYIGGAFANNATSYTGFSIFSTAGNITGQVSTFGYRKS